MQNPGEIQKRILFPLGNRTCADSASYGKKILFSGDSHIVTVKIHKLNNSFKETNFLINLQIKLPKEKQDIAVIFIRRNNVTYNIDMFAAILAENIMQIVKNVSTLVFLKKKV